MCVSCDGVCCAARWQCADKTLMVVVVVRRRQMQSFSRHRSLHGGKADGRIALWELQPYSFQERLSDFAARAMLQGCERVHDGGNVDDADTACVPRRGVPNMSSSVHVCNAVLGTRWSVCKQSGHLHGAALFCSECLGMCAAPPCLDGCSCDWRHTGTFTWAHARHAHFPSLTYFFQQPRT